MVTSLAKCKVIFSENDSKIVKDGKVIGRGIRKRGLYVMKLGKKPEDKICLATIDENSTFLCGHRYNKTSNHPSPIRSYGGNLYTLVIIDDYFRMDHDREFDNEVQFGEFCNANGITHKFLALRTPHSNGVETTLDYFKVLGRKCFILNTKDYLTKFILKLYEGVFLGYSQNSKAYIILNKHTMKIEESLNVTFDKTPPLSKTSPLVDDDLDEEEEVKITEKKNLENDNEDETLEVDKIVNIKESKNYPLENVTGNLNQ
ncbi:retrovirus-related pol polyprotein from transposon TNT 1-94 [Tanacetum coccineum]